MRVKMPRVAALVLLALAHPGDFTDANAQVDFTLAGSDAANEAVGTLRDGVAADDTAVATPQVLTPAPASPSVVNFNATGSFSAAGTLHAPDATDAPSTGNDSAVFTVGSSNSSRYTTLPPSQAVDLQGFPFLGTADWKNATATTNATTTASTAVTTVATAASDDDWARFVCSGPKTSCKALQLGQRRLADTPELDQKTMTEVMEKFYQGFMVSTASELLLNIVSSGALLMAGMVFSFALESMLPSWSEQWEKITAELQKQAAAVQAVAVKAEVDMPFINVRSHLMLANDRAAAFGIQRLSFGTDLSILCAQNGGPEAELTAYFTNSKRYRETLKPYCGASKECVMTGAVFYIKSVVQPFANALTCMYHRDKNSASLKARGSALLAQVKTVMTEFVKDSEDVRDKFLTPVADDPTIKSVDQMFARMVKMDQKAAREYAKSEISKSFSWLDYVVIVSDSAAVLCPKGYAFKVYVNPKQDKGVGMLLSPAQKQSVVLGWKHKDDGDAKLVDELLDSPQAADARAAQVIEQCGGEAKVSGLALVPVHGEAADWETPSNSFVGSNRRERQRQRRLAQAYKCEQFRLVGVCGKTYADVMAKTPPPATNTSFDNNTIDAIIAEGKAAGVGNGQATDLNPQAVTDYFNTYADDQKTLQDLVTSFGPQEWVHGMALRDPAVLAYAQLGLGLINEVTEREVKQIDHVSDVLDQTHQAQVTALNGVNNKLIETHGKEMSGLKNMENDMTKYHREEIKMYDTIDTHVSEMGAAISSGFTATQSKVDAVDAAVSGQLSSLNDLIGATAQETRANVVGFLRETTQKTMGSLDNLEGHINRLDQQTLQGVGLVRDSIVSTQTKLRENIASVFQAQQAAFSSGAAETSQLVQQVGQRVLYALLYDVGAVHDALTQQLNGIGTHIDVVKGRLTTVEKGFDDLQVQVDKMLSLLSTIQQRTNRIFRTLQNFPQKIAAILLQGEVKKRLDDYKKLNYAFTRYVENGMRALYKAELVDACDTYSNAGDLLYYFTSNVGVEGGDEAVVKHFRKFEYHRGDYEKFGGQTIVAAYGVQRLSLTCAYLKEDLTREQFIQRAMLWDKEIDAAMYLFQMNVEEVLPRFFLSQYYTPQMVQGYLNEARQQAGDAVAVVASAGATGFSLAAIEMLRYLIQQDLGSFASVSVIHVPDAAALRVWSSPVGTGSAHKRQGLLRQLSNVLVLWSSTKKQLPTELRDAMQIPLQAADLANAEALGNKFRGTALEAYWQAGVIQSVIHTTKVTVEGSSTKACPWAVSSTHYPLCWEIRDATSGSGDSCACVQLEGIPDELSADALTASKLVPSYHTLATTLENAQDPRSGFLIAASSTMNRSLTANEMLGVPANRKSLAACMTSALPPVVCDVPSPTGAKLCQQPPPQFTRCVADTANSYSIVYAVPNASASASGNESDAPLSATFIASGSTVTAAMFRTLELGATLPQISFFDEPNGAGNYVVCRKCDMRDFKTVYMFRIMSFKIGRPRQEKDAVCITHPRLKNVEYCPRGTTRKTLWTSQVLVETELIQRVQHIGQGIASGVTDAQALASLVNDGMQALVNNDFAFFKVYVAKSGSFNAMTNGDAYWTSLPTQAAALERGWSVVPKFYTTVTSDDKVVTYDALLMWSTLPVVPRNFAALVVAKKPTGQALRAYLESAFSAYQKEKILRGFFSEPFDGPDCPVAGDTDHFAYCTPTPVDKMCLCVQLEDLPEEYTELYDGSAPNGKVVSFPLDVDQSTYVVGRSKGPFSLGSQVATATWDGLPMRNVSERSVCVSDYNHPELGATCITTDGSALDEMTLEASQTSRGVAMGGNVETVTIEAGTWSAQCVGCTGQFVAEIAHQDQDTRAIRMGGYVAGGECRNALASGGGVLTLCLK